MKHLQNLLVASMFLLTYPFVRAEAINGTNSVFYVNDALDRGCKHQAANAKSPCPTCNTKGVPDWWVSDPWINLWVSDKPAAYTTSLGQEMSFQITYNQRDSRLTNANSRLAGGVEHYPTTGWNHNWWSYIRVIGNYDVPNQPLVLDFTHWNAIVYTPGGGETYYAYNQKSHPGDATQLLPQSGVDARVAPATYGEQGDDYGFRLVYPDGSQDIYGQQAGFEVWQDGTRTTAFNAVLSERIDPFGNSTHLYYSNYVNAGTITWFLQYVVDLDGRTNTFSYTGGLLTRVDMPYGLYVTMGYNAKGQMTNITDTMGMASTFAYDGATGYMTNMLTPYGTNIFEHTDLGNIASDGNNVGNAGGTNRVSRACRITSPDGSHELYAYRFDSSEVGIPDNYSAQAPSGTPLNTLDIGGTTYLQSMSYLRNSYHWNAKQY